MKKYAPYFAAALIGCLIALATGCASQLAAGKLPAFATPVITTNQTPVVTQTADVEPTSTNQLTDPITGAAYSVTNWQTNIIQKTNFVAQLETQLVMAPLLSNTLAKANIVNNVTAPFDPYSLWVKLGLGAVAAGTGWYINLMNKKLSSHASVAQTVVNAVTSLAPEIQPVVTAAIHAEAAKAGTSGIVYAALQAAIA